MGLARRSVLKALAEQFGPVFDAEAHEAGVDEVEFLVIGPLFFDIVNFEFDVWRNPLSTALSVAVLRVWFLHTSSNREHSEERKAEL